MLDKDPAFQHLIKNTNLEVELAKAKLDLVDKISVGKDVIKIGEHNVFYLHSTPLDEGLIKGHILFLHDQTNTSAVWLRIKSLQTFAAFGYHCIAPDLPCMGRTGGPPLNDLERANFINFFLKALNVHEIIIIASSMAGKYAIPLLNQKINKKNFVRLSCLIAIALSDTNKLFIENTECVMIPCLALRGAFDTSLGLSAADAFSKLTNSRVVIVPNGKHLCHQSHPDYFHKIVLNFLNVLTKNITKSIFVTKL